MSEQKNANGLGEPEPVDKTDGWRTLIYAGSIFAVVCGGFLAFANLVAPTRLSGATRSAKLKWQQRHLEIEQAIAGSEESQPLAESFGKVAVRRYHQNRANGPLSPSEVEREDEAVSGQSLPDQAHD